MSCLRTCVEASEYSEGMLTVTHSGIVDLDDGIPRGVDVD